MAALAEGSGDWLESLPIASIGLKLDDSSVRIAVGLRLGTPLVHPHQCCCGIIVPSDGHHGLSCRKSTGRQSCHSQINDTIHRAFICAGVLASREPVGLCNSAGVTGKRPDEVSTVPGKKGRCDLDTFANSHIQKSSRPISAGPTAKTAENYKRAKYFNLTAVPSNQHAFGASKALN